MRAPFPITNLSLTPGSEVSDTYVGYAENTPVMVYKTGYAPHTFWVYKQIYDQETGCPVEGLYADLNGDGSIDSNDLGLRLMVDFHFSDTWADPGKQYIPSAWSELDLDGVLAAMTDHVNSVLGALQREGIEPEWVQIGNETRTGMMWPLGSIDSGDNFTRMVNTGHDAVKAIFPDALVIVHCDCGNEQYLYDRLFGKLKNEGARYDMVGMSLYPEEHNWEKLVDDCVANAKYCTTTFGKPVMICEIGMAYDQSEIADKMMRKLYSDGKAADIKGIFWWEPETPVGSNGYNKGCVDADGVPTAALSVFVNE